MVTKVFTYGAKPPKSHLAEIERQMVAGHRYRNKLAELEIERRKRAEALLADLCPGVAIAAANLQQATVARDEALAAAAKLNSTTRSKSMPKETRENIAKLRQAVRDAVEVFKTEKKEGYLNPAYVEAQEAISDWHKTSTKEARATCGCYWGTYLLAEAAMENAHKGKPPKFLRWRGDGTLGVQMQGGLTIPDCLDGNDTRFTIQIDHSASARGYNKGKRRALCRFRIGSVEGKRDGIYAEIPIFYHRPLPPDGLIKQAKLIRTNIGGQNHWELQITVTYNEVDAYSDLPEDSMVAIHPGWKMLDDGSLHVATWVGSDGQTGRVVIDAFQVGSAAVPQSLRSTRDLNQNTAMLQFRSWLEMQDATSLPEWFVERTKHVHAWKSPERLASLVWHWKDNRFAGDEQIYPILSDWRKQDKHLNLRQSHQTEKTAVVKRDIYRKLASDLSKKYRYCSLAAMSFKELLETPNPEDPDQVSNQVRRNGYFASPGLLNLCFKQKFGKRAIEVSSIHISDTCHKCGCETSLQDSQVVCAVCGSFDREINAARNQLLRAKEVLDGRMAHLGVDADEPQDEPKEGPRKIRRNRKKPKDDKGDKGEQSE